MEPSLIEIAQQEADGLWDCISTMVNDDALLFDFGFQTNERPSAIYVAMVAPAIHPSLGKGYFLGQMESYHQKLESSKAHLKK